MIIKERQSEGGIGMIVKEIQHIVSSAKTGTYAQQRYGMQEQIIFAQALQQSLELRQSQALIHGNNNKSC